MAFDFSQLKVLVVDDNEFMQRILTELLIALSFHRDKILKTGDGSSALKILSFQSPDLVICDLNMKPMNGKRLTQLIRSADDSANPYVPIIVCTGHSEIEHIVDARDAGATEILRKPISAASLYSRLRAIVESPRPFIKSPIYVGPDRRRRDLPFDGPDRRTQIAEIG
ncbi:MAG: response regulator [Alphaproteobacteria bacterium]|nr:response regulator [Alphaproteobacteria bacterium]